MLLYFHEHYSANEAHLAAALPRYGCASPPLTGSAPAGGSPIRLRLLSVLFHDHLGAGSSVTQTRARRQMDLEVLLLHRRIDLD